MENIQQPAQRGDEDGSINGDRISRLPKPVLHRILSLLSPEEAVRTCVLSKSWRFIGTTRPKIEFRERHFRGNKEKFLSVLDNTLQRYFEQNLLLHELILGVPAGSDCLLVSLIEKWLPIVLMKMGVKVFSLSAFFPPLPLPLVVLQAEFLEELHLTQCKLNNQNKNGIVKLHMLKRLSLRYVWIEEETFEKIMSSCPLIQHLVLESCQGLSNVKVNNAHYLKHFDCYVMEKDGTIEINDAPSLETLRINGGYGQSRNLLHNNYFFPRLKSFSLYFVHLPTELLNNLSTNFPCLEELKILHCSGFSELKLSSRSIKHLVLHMPYHPTKAAIHIEAANILCFEFVGSYFPSIISFTTTSREWRSRIEVLRSDGDALSPWSLKLHEFLKALSQSQISLDIAKIHLMNQDMTYDGDSCEPVVVEHLYLREYCLAYDEVPTLLNCMFRICRPKYIGLSLYSNSQKKHEKQLGESILKTLVKKGETSQCDFWQQDLEESSIQVLEDNAHGWRPVQVYGFSNNEEIRFRLKWRD